MEVSEEEMKHLIDFYDRGFGGQLHPPPRTGGLPQLAHLSSEQEDHEFLLEQQQQHLLPRESVPSPPNASPSARRDLSFYDDSPPSSIRQHRKQKYKQSIERFIGKAAGHRTRDKADSWDGAVGSASGGEHEHHQQAPHEEDGAAAGAGPEETAMTDAEKRRKKRDEKERDRREKKEEREREKEREKADRDKEKEKDKDTKERAPKEKRVKRSTSAFGLFGTGGSGVRRKARKEDAKDKALLDDGEHAPAAETLDHKEAKEKGEKAQHQRGRSAREKNDERRDGKERGKRDEKEKDKEKDKGAKKKHGSLPAKASAAELKHADRSSVAKYSEAELPASLRSRPAIRESDEKGFGAAIRAIVSGEKLDAKFNRDATAVDKAEPKEGAEAKPRTTKSGSSARRGISHSHKTESDSSSGSGSSNSSSTKERKRARTLDSGSAAASAIFVAGPAVPPSPRSMPSNSSPLSGPAATSYSLPFASVATPTASASSSSSSSTSSPALIPTSGLTSTLTVPISVSFLSSGHSRSESTLPVSTSSSPPASPPRALRSAVITPRGSPVLPHASVSSSSPTTTTTTPMATVGGASALGQSSSSSSLLSTFAVRTPPSPRKIPFLPSPRGRRRADSREVLCREAADASSKHGKRDKDKDKDQKEPPKDGQATLAPAAATDKSLQPDAFRSADSTLLSHTPSERLLVRQQQEKSNALEGSGSAELLPTPTVVAVSPLGGGGVDDGIPAFHVRDLLAAGGPRQRAEDHHHHGPAPASPLMSSVLMTDHHNHHHNPHHHHHQQQQHAESHRERQLRRENKRMIKKLEQKLGRRKETPSRRSPRGEKARRGKAGSSSSPSSSLSASSASSAPSKHKSASSKSERSGRSAHAKTDDRTDRRRRRVRLPGETDEDHSSLDELGAGRHAKGNGEGEGEGDVPSFDSTSSIDSASDSDDTSTDLSGSEGTTTTTSTTEDSGRSRSGSTTRPEYAGDASGVESGVASDGSRRSKRRGAAGGAGGGKLVATTRDARTDDKLRRRSSRSSRSSSSSGASSASSASSSAAGSRRGSSSESPTSSGEATSSDSETTAVSDDSDEESDQIELYTIPSHVKEEIVRINVGGYRYTTTTGTLMGLNLPRHRAAVDNYFTSILSGKFTTVKDDSGAYFIDRDGQYFAPILTFLRTGVCSVPQGTSIDAVIREAEFYCIQPLVDELRRKQEDLRLSRTDMTKAEFFHCLTMARIKGFMLSMSGMKMRGMDFSHMQLLNVHFSMCDLEGANFSNAILNKAQFHAANLKNVRFIHSIFSSHTNPFSRTTNLNGVLFHRTDNALALYGQSFKEWGYRTENVSLALYGMSFKQLGFQMENVNTLFYSRNIVRLVKEKEDPLVLEEEEKPASALPL